MIKKSLLLPLVILALAVPGYGLYSYLAEHDAEQSVASAVSLNKAKMGTDSSVDVMPVGTKATNHQSKLETDASVSAVRSNTNPNSPADSALTHPELEVASERYNQVNDNARYPTLQARITELEALNPNLSFEPNQLVDLLAEPNAWQATDLPARNLPLTDEERNDGREFIELKPERLLVALPGDLLELPIEQLGLNLEMQVEHRELLPNGGFVLHGRVLGTDELMRVTLSQAPGLSIAGIETPQGHYVLQANDGHGWIASSETLFKQDEYQHDMVIPPDNE